VTQPFILKNGKEDLSDYGRPKACGRPEQADTFGTFKPIFCRPRTALENVLEGACPNSDSFRRNCVACGKPEFTGAIFPIIPVISLRPI
jgi:hypothetical protein